MLKKTLLLATAALFLLSVTLFAPATITHWIEAAIGWQPLSEAPSIAESPLLRTAVERIEPAGLAAHLAALTTDSSRVTGYPGGASAARCTQLSSSFSASIFSAVVALRLLS